MHEPVHITTGLCWCLPKLERAGDGWVIIHRRYGTYIASAWGL